MKKFLVFILLVIRMQGISQPADAPEKEMVNKIDSLTQERTTKNDTAAGKSYLYETDPSTLSRNLDSFFQLQQEQRAKKKKAAILRIAIGVLLLVVLIIGIRRRK